MSSTILFFLVFRIPLLYLWAVVWKVLFWSITSKLSHHFDSHMHGTST